jgi:hypothetical protein
MFPALYDDDRRVLARLATMLVLGALCVLPLTTQSSPIARASGVRDNTEYPNLAPPAQLTFPAYEISRDPFVPEGAMRAKLDYSVPMSGGQGSDIDVALPANPDATQGAVSEPIRAPLGIGPVVRAIVLGYPPRALIETDGSVRVLGIGDTLGGLTIAGITAGRVSLSDGSTLILDSERK